MATLAEIQTPRMATPALSPLMQAKSRLQTGEKANACPFGCEMRQLDQHGYCRHLVGFTNDDEKKVKKGEGLMEPMKRTKHGRKVVVKRQVLDQIDEDGFSEEGEPILDPIPRNAVLVKITVSSRVYVDVDAQKTEPKK